MCMNLIIHIYEKNMFMTTTQRHQNVIENVFKWYDSICRGVVHIELEFVFLLKQGVSVGSNSDFGKDLIQIRIRLSKKGRIQNQSEHPGFKSLQSRVFSQYLSTKEVKEVFIS